MSYDEYLAISAEVHELESLLAEIPADRALERIGLEARVRSARAAIAGVDPLRFSASRIHDGNIRETDETFSGELQGVLPSSRSFEFKLTDPPFVLTGKVGPGIQDADVLSREFLHRPVTVRLHVIQVGQGRPRYSLLSLDDIVGDPGNHYPGL
jgi:hypothetical protein